MQTQDTTKHTNKTDLEFKHEKTTKSYVAILGFRGTTRHKIIKLVSHVTINHKTYLSTC